MTTRWKSFTVSRGLGYCALILYFTFTFLVILQMLLSDLQWEGISGDWVDLITQFKLLNNNNSSLYISNAIRWTIQKLFCLSKDRL